jgi:hypothetical protein
MTNTGLASPLTGLRSWWQDKRVATAAQLLLLLTTGLVAAAGKSLTPSLGISGSSAPLWLTFIVLGRLMVKKPGSAGIVGASMAMWGIPLGLNHTLGYNLGLYAGTGIAVDILASLPFVKVRHVLGAIAGGMAAHMVKFGFILYAALATSAAKRFIISGIAKSAGQHLLFGAASGLLAWALYWGARRVYKGIKKSS